MPPRLQRGAGREPLRFEVFLDLVHPEDRSGLNDAVRHAIARACRSTSSSGDRRRRRRQPTSHPETVGGRAG
jgi:hypothetical protein